MPHLVIRWTALPVRPGHGFGEYLLAPESSLLEMTGVEGSSGFERLGVCHLSFGPDERSLEDLLGGHGKNELVLA